jgi:hypothetical protein
MKNNLIKYIAKETGSIMIAWTYSEIMDQVYAGERDVIDLDEIGWIYLDTMSIKRKYRLKHAVLISILNDLVDYNYIEKKVYKKKIVVKLDVYKISDVIKRVKESTQNQEIDATFINRSKQD